MLICSLCKFDWEVRVRLGKIAYDYHQLDEPEDREYLHAALVEIEKRFPNLSPSHIFRRIDKQGHKAVEKWWMDIAKWVQTAAGKMRVTLEELEGHVEILVGKKKNVKYDPTRLLGLKCADVNYVLWGKTPSGEDKCHDLIEKEVDIWKKKDTAAIAKDGRIIGQYRLGVEGRIQREQFGLLPASVRQHYTTLAKGGVALTPEQQKAAAEALIPNLVNTCSRSSAVANMHILLFASTVTTGNRIPVVMKEFGADPVNGPFLDGQDLGTRVKAEYRSYAGRLWKGDPSQIDLLDKSVEEDPPPPAKQNDSTKSKGKRNAVPAVPENPQHPTKPSYTEWKPLAAVRTEKQQIDYMGSFFGSTYCNNFFGQMKWNPISANNDLYIDPVHRPEDQHGEPLPLSNPQAMPGPLLQSWWNFLQDCANGEIAEDRHFMWKSEETRLNLPDIAAPEDPGIHTAGELAKSTVSCKRARGEPNRPRKSQKQKSKVKPMSTVDDEEDEMLEDLEDLREDAEKWGADPNDELEPSRALR
ncbi:hypothetical protein FRC04_005773 [Tulasnella sp. 424]|nr:hypothetical protein FRC04_005773 [Tulasnella sp. 424]KAG8961929.1 hypothetical protein FRC05_005652 [Tulasnella sp. 425]